MIVITLLVHFLADEHEKNSVDSMRAETSASSIPLFSDNLQRHRKRIEHLLLEYDYGCSILEST